MIVSNKRIQQFFWHIIVRVIDNNLTIPKHLMRGPKKYTDVTETGFEITSPKGDFCHDCLIVWNRI